jgi:hypothetical protein
MNVLFLIFLFAVIPFLLFLLITRSFLKAILFSAIFHFIVFSFISFIIVTDAVDLAKMQSSSTLFIYAPENEFQKGIILNFSSTSTKTLLPWELEKAQKDLINAPSKVTNRYTRTFIFSEKTMILLLDDTIQISEGFSLTKEEIMQGIDSSIKEESDSFFLIAISNIFQNIADPTNLETLIGLYKEKELKTYPSIKALSFLSFLPSEILNPLLSKAQQLIQKPI